MPMTMKNRLEPSTLAMTKRLIERIWMSRMRAVVRFKLLRKMLKRRGRLIRSSFAPSAMAR